MPGLRVSEWVGLIAVSWLTALGWLRPGLLRTRRTAISAAGAAGLASILVPALLLPRIVPPLAASVVRDWAPYILVFVFYTQAGLFVVRTHAELEKRLRGLDAALAAPLLAPCAVRPWGAWLLGYGELAYMSYYVALPGAMAALYLAHKRNEAGRFWTAALLAEFLSSVTLLYIPTRPPRAFPEKWSAGLPSGKLRAFNLWILDRGSIQTNTFPSAHVAITTACALVVLQFAPLWLGLVFLWTAASIAFGAVAGRYHYAADAILGFAVGAAASVAGLAVS